MPFRATVIRVLIASPGDTGNARRTLRELMEDWNSVHAEASGVILLPVMWERDGVPAMGDTPQAILNRQIVDAADLLVGTFWTRLGTPTAEAESGTVEEIERFIAAGKRVLLYFSNEPVHPDSVNPQEYGRLADFRESLRSRGLYDSYSDESELWRKANGALTRVIREEFDVAVSDEPPAASLRLQAALVARVEREREVSGFNRQGRPQYRTRERLVIENRGTAAAESLTFSFEGEPPEGMTLPHVIGSGEPITRLAPGAALEFPLMVHAASVSQWDVVLRWQEGDEEREEREERQTVRG